MTFGRVSSPLRLLSLAVLGVVVASTVAGFFVIRAVVNDEQRRLLKDRTQEVGLVIQALFGPVVSALPQLASSDVTQPGAHSEFVKEAKNDLQIARRSALSAQVGTGFDRSCRSGRGCPRAPWREQIGLLWRFGR